jgi:hypothetical protein
LRRPVLRAALVTVVLVVAGAATWYVVGGSGEARNHSGDLHRFLIPITPDPPYPFTIVAPRSTPPAGPVPGAETNEAGTDPGSRHSVMVSLLRFDSPAAARAFVASPIQPHLFPGPRTPVPGVPGAVSATSQTSVLVAGSRGDVVFWITLTGGTVDEADRLARQQYDRL